MPADRWLGVGSCGGAQELAGARPVDDALIHDDREIARTRGVRGFHNHALAVLSVG